MNYWKTILTAVLLLILVAVAAGVVRDWRVAADFPAIRAQSSEADVLQLMGEPKQVQKSCSVFDTVVTPACDHVFIYRSIFSPVESKYWLVFFDENSRVTATSSQMEP
ncbi:hypothetical protein [Edaphobacter flagellatus]|uniref:hypothetical protein n=1 Tax=Edaphobacter flagellatus TaxID=1933044 RepID=UPI0021B2F765|nr:hypothetical protein [Edaphobacter flagellatus]